MFTSFSRSIRKSCVLHKLRSFYVVLGQEKIRIALYVMILTSGYRQRTLFFFFVVSILLHLMPTCAETQTGITTTCEARSLLYILIRLVWKWYFLSTIEQQRNIHSNLLLFNHKTYTTIYIRAKTKQRLIKTFFFI